MTQWIVIGEKRYEMQRLGLLSTFQLADACDEVGMTPERLEECVSPSEVDKVSQTDRMRALGVMVFAARVLAGEQHRSVRAANDFPMEDLSFEDDDEVVEDPTPAASEEAAGDQPSPLEPSEASST